MALSETARDQVSPRLRQVAFFLPNRLGALRRGLQLLAKENVRIAGISVLESTDHAVVRLVVDRPDGATDILAAASYGTCITECLGVTLPPGPRFGIMQVLSHLLAAEVSVSYAYALIAQALGSPILALQVDDCEMAGQVLKGKGFALVGQDDLLWPDAQGA